MDLTLWFLLGYTVFVLSYAAYLHSKLDNSYSDCLLLVILVWPALILQGIKYHTKVYPKIFKKKGDHK